MGTGGAFEGTVLRPRRKKVQNPKQRDSAGKSSTSGLLCYYLPTSKRLGNTELLSRNATALRCPALPGQSCVPAAACRAPHPPGPRVETEGTGRHRWDSMMGKRGWRGLC